MPLSPGDKLGPYEIIELIGKGGMGEVYRAHDDRLRRDVAIKVSNAPFSERFTREARTVASLNHTNIAHLYDVGPNYLVMELVEGADLKGPMSFDDALPIIHQLINGIEAAHAKNIIHRDLKPANIRVTPEGVVKILDFGLAKATDTAPSQDADPGNSPTLTMGATAVGTILGTAAYMAPEQAKGKTADKRSDVWSVGVVVYELLTGQRLFAGESAVEILGSVLNKEPDFSAAPARVHRLLRWCLERDRKKRLASISDARGLLDEVVPVMGPIAKKSSLLPWSVAAVFAVAGAGLAYVAVPHFRETPAKLVKFEFAAPGKGVVNVTNGAPAVSPDGRRVTFGADVDGKSMLWVRDLDSLQARMLLDTQNASTPFWGPDSNQVAFGVAGKLIKIDVAGGRVTTIANTTQLRGGDWNQNGVILFATQDTGLLRVSASGGTPVRATELDKSRKERRHAYPQFLPDGRHFVYLALSSDVEKSGIFVGDLESKDTKLVLPATSNARYVERAGQGHLLFVREGALLAQPFDTGKLATTGDAVPIVERVDVPLGTYSSFGSSRDGVLAYTSDTTAANVQMTWVDRTGKVLRTVGQPTDIQSARLSPSGKLLAVDRLDPQSGNRDIWIHDLVRGTEQRLTFTDRNAYPVWSPDELRLVFQWRRGPAAAIVGKAADGSSQEEELEPGGNRPTDWTHDGGSLIMETPVGNSSGNDLWSLPLSTGAKPGAPVQLRKTQFNENRGRVSPDGRWLAFQSDESGRNQVYVMGFPSLSGPWQVSVNDGRRPVWRRDGRELYFIDANNKMMAVEVKPGAEFQRGLPRPLFDLPLGPSNVNGDIYDIGPDARFLIATPVAQAASVPMTVMLNWQAALRK